MHITAYHRPRTLEEAWQHKAADPGACFIAGGTDLLVRMREGSRRPNALVSLRNIPELHGVEITPSRVLIGALTPVARLTEHEALGAAVPALVVAAKRLGSQQVRNLATAGGNLCNASPCADLAPPLLVLDAKLRVVSPAGARELPLADFFVAPGSTRIAADEIVAAIVFDRLPEHAGCHFLKKGRVAMDIAIVSAAVMLELAGDRCVRARVAVGSAAPRPTRLPRTEQLLQGRVLDAATLAEARVSAAAEVQPISDKRATATYRREVAGVFVERAARAVIEEVRR